MGEVDRGSSTIGMGLLDQLEFLDVDSWQGISAMTDEDGPDNWTGAGGSRLGPKRSRPCCSELDLSRFCPSSEFLQWWRSRFQARRKRGGGPSDGVAIFAKVDEEIFGESTGRTVSEYGCGRDFTQVEDQEAGVLGY